MGIGQNLTPNLYVITTEKGNVRKLNYYFENETDFGKRKKEAEDTARREL